MFTKWHFIISPIFLNWNSTVRKRCPFYPIYLFMHSVIYINIDSWVFIGYYTLLIIIQFFPQTIPVLAVGSFFKLASVTPPSFFLFQHSCTSHYSKIFRLILYFPSNFPALESTIFSSVFISFQELFIETIQAYSFLIAIMPLSEYSWKILV